MPKQITPVILSGGSGTRLWPLSRTMFPKQFLPLAPGSDLSMLGITLRRLPAGPTIGQPLILCNADHRFLVRDDLERAGLTARGILLEPVARNTAPAIAAAAVLLARGDADAIMVVMASDHVIADEAEFRRAVERAVAVAAEGRLALFGITPSQPNTGYGYIEQGAALPGHERAFAVRRFAEKPSRDVAERYVASGTYLWNSGIFVLPVSAFIAELRRHAPAVLAAAEAAIDAARDDMGFTRLDPAAFAQAPAISIDYAVMEKTEMAAVLPMDIGWSDIGDWSALLDISEHDAAGNALIADAIIHDTSGCYVRSGHRLIAALGVHDLVIVDTDDALLVADKSRSQDVAKIVADLKSKGRSEHEQHVRSHRPWGYFESLATGTRFQVKKLHVRPGGKLSLQMHHHRSEHWIVVQGTARVTVEDRESLVRENESIYISATQWHRLENPGKVPLELIEVQIGSYLGEDDIIRSDDIYNRRPEETK